jgi:hypothetical protein
VLYLQYSSVNTAHLIVLLVVSRLDYCNATLASKPAWYAGFWRSTHISTSPHGVWMAERICHVQTGVSDIVLLLPTYGEVPRYRSVNFCRVAVSDLVSLSLAILLSLLWTIISSTASQINDSSYTLVTINSPVEVTSTQQSQQPAVERCTKHNTIQYFNPMNRSVLTSLRLSWFVHSYSSLI